MINLAEKYPECYAGIGIYPRCCDGWQETDAPSMPSRPFHSTNRSEPAHVRVIAECFAVIHKTGVVEVARITTQNAIRLFGLEEGIYGTKNKKSI